MLVACGRTRKKEQDILARTYRCPGGKQLTTTGTVVNDGTTLLYRASKHDCHTS